MLFQQWSLLGLKSQFIHTAFDQVEKEVDKVAESLCF